MNEPSLIIPDPQPDPMKPMFDRMTEMVVASLSGSGKEFYDREFEFFEEVTSISGKLKPYIRKTKPEKKVRSVDDKLYRWSHVCFVHRRKSTKRWRKSRSTLVYTYLATQMVSLSTLTNDLGVHCKAMQK